ncbi:M13 family metallopeptidase [Luteococcus sp. Sow4_B9]|uniref:M13 family metallopeptidase n=1 Tax=Luteococcus sp. Sow4_B9 TaxID=3438792 RepID=UPI003F95027B
MGPALDHPALDHPALDHPALDASALDPATRPQDDLFRHVNGSWLTRTPIDADKASASAFQTVREQSRQAVREIVEELAADGAPDPGSEAGKIAALYGTFMDTETVEALGAAPLLPLLERVDRIADAQSLAQFWGWCLQHELSAPFALGPDADMDNPTRYAMFCHQSGLGLPDREYYLEDSHAELREAYLAHVAEMLGLAGVADADEQAALVLDLETRIAAAHWTRERSRDLGAKHNPTSWARLTEELPALHLDAVARGLAVEADELDLVINCQPSYLSGLAELVTDENLPAWRAWARWHLVHDLANFLSDDFVTGTFDFYQTRLMGVQEQEPRWKRGVALVEWVLGMAVGRIYVERYFSPEARQRMDELVAHLLEAYRQSISQLDWMGEQTRQEALHKLEQFRPKIGHPRAWRSHDALEVIPGDLVGSILQGGLFEWRRAVDKLRTPMDPDEWLMYPQTVNAYYHPLRNEIVFPAAILQPPFFNPQADDAVNYGAIGSVIGHEIGHGFDDQGSRCDGDGRLRDWWTAEDRAAFSARADALKAQYAALTPRQLTDDDPRPHVNGELTIGENIGDLGGLGIALKAWQISTDGEDPEPVDGLTGLQRLFHGYATIWRAKYRDETARRLLVIDPHSPAEFRTNQVAMNQDAFHEAFQTAPGDGMWLAPEERVRIW